MSEENKVVVRRYFEEMLNQGNLSVAGEVFAADMNFGGSYLPEMRGIEAAKGFCASIRTAFPDIHYDVIDLIAEADKVAVRWSATGVHQGEWLGVAATGKRINVTGTTTFRLSGGKIEDHWVDWDALAQMRQLGVLPEEG